MGIYVVFVAGGIASGKSTVSRRLQRLGEARIDLDEVSRSVLMPGSPVLAEVAAEFGQDLLNPATGELDRAAEYLMLGMRTVRGISPKEYHNIYRSDFTPLEEGCTSARPFAL